MPRYRVMIYGGLDGLTFDDLVVKYTSGYQYALKVKRGDYVPVEIFDPLDIQKSLAVGTLRHFLDRGAVVVEYSDLEKKKKQRKPRKKKQHIEDVKPTLKPSVEVEKPQQKSEETKPAEPEQIDLKDVKIKDDFFKLSFFNKLQYVKTCKDKSLLTDLLEKLPEDAKQLKVRITYRIQEL